MGKENTESKILKILLKQFSITWTVTSLSNEIKISRVGIWKVMKKLEKEGLIVLTQIGQGKTSTASIKLNWENIILEKKLALILTEETLDYQRWLKSFEELKEITEFVILYGSILNYPQEANDIDFLEMVSNKKSFLKIEKVCRDCKKPRLKKYTRKALQK